MSGKVEEIPDVFADPDYALTETSKLVNSRAVVAVPMRRDGVAIGAIALDREAAGHFPERQVKLLQAFADQAVIAIENVRLFEEVQARTRELTESLERQTAGSDILKVIARSPNDVQPVFDTIAMSVAQLCAARYCIVFGFDGKLLHFVAHHGLPPEAVAGNREVYPIPPGRQSAAARAILSRTVEQIPDVEADPDFAHARITRRAQVRSLIAVPMLKDDVPAGAIVVARQQVGVFPERQIDLLKTFADQAVIAIGNVRLFEEVQARTAEVTEALQQQTATADVLKVISRSAIDLSSVLQTLVESAARLCEADKAAITRQIDGVFYRAHTYGFSREFAESVRTLPVEPGKESVSSRALQEGRVIHIEDVRADPDYTFGAALQLGGVRTALGVPMFREGLPIGVLSLTRSEVRPFTEKQIELVSTFADQAAIAIENARLFEELRTRSAELSEALQQQTATADVLKVISRSPTDIRPVLDAVGQSAARLCEADNAVILLLEGSALRQVGAYGHLSTSSHPIDGLPVNRDTVTGRAVVEARPIHIHDLSAEEDEYPEGSRHAKADGHRTTLATPLLREGVPIGAILIRRTEVRPFSEKQIDLLTTFADQAAIAIANVRLFDEVTHRTDELSRSLEDLQTAQDRLVQTEKLASLGQLTAGIAHEIKNPLNFINNFSALSAELVSELDSLLEGAGLNDSVRRDVKEVCSTLEVNLEKVVQHGRRADSIVKNMLLHSRAGSGEHRPSDINSIVEESLNLAYHGARAANKDFKISLQTALDPNAGEVDVYPQEITRVLINLISNSFYATDKRGAQGNAGAYRPMLVATTRNLGDQVQISIRDNGTGIPADVKERIFNPFFTTKPAGEGTGLGLSLSHDIVVKQHAGTIEVETEPGAFTDFRIVLPRRAASLGQLGGQT